ncbi:hypothetical protein NKG05_30505 [Oerskovia sp. M15]
MGNEAQRATRAAFTIATIGLALGACSSAPDIDSTNPYAAEYKSALENSISDFERGVLEDGAVSNAEYNEAVDRYLACMRDLGVDVTTEPNGDLYQYVTPMITEFDKHDPTCRTGTIASIELLYDGFINNPENVDPAEERPSAWWKPGWRQRVLCRETWRRPE